MTRQKKFLRSSSSIGPELAQIAIAAGCTAATSLATASTGTVLLPSQMSQIAGHAVRDIALLAMANTTSLVICIFRCLKDDLLQSFKPCVFSGTALTGQNSSLSAIGGYTSKKSSADSLIVLAYRLSFT